MLNVIRIRIDLSLFESIFQTDDFVAFKYIVFA